MNASLVSALAPMRSPAMARAEACGRSLATLFAAVPAKEVASIADLAGPESIAFAAGAARAFDQVFVFDNWPHPLGVVPSHETLAAALYYYALFREISPDRPPDLPPLFVLDRRRLSPYTDASDRFDNRYAAKLPTAANLAALGVKHVLYVTEGASIEADDLNDDLLAYADAHIDVKAVALSDFSGREDQLYYGGSPETHAYFWHHYAWYAPLVALGAVAPLAVSRGYAYAPARRSTMFSGVGPSKRARRLRQRLGEVRARDAPERDDIRRFAELGHPPEQRRFVGAIERGRREQLMDYAFFGVQVLFTAARGDPLRAELGQIVRASPERATLVDKRSAYQRVRGVMDPNVARFERAYWDYISDPAKAETEFETWCSELEKLASEPRTATSDYRSGASGAALFTMVFLLARGHAADAVAAERCDVAEPDFFRRSVIQSLIDVPPLFNFATVKADGIYVVPGDDDDGLSQVELADEGWAYLKPIID